MNSSEILSHVDHTQLKAYATWDDIIKLCEEAIRLKTASVCVPPCYVGKIREAFTDQVRICTVVGFPLGYSVTEAKVAEVKQALLDGADEIDVVVNICDVKNHDFGAVKEELTKIRKACGTHILKVIIETCYLTEEEKIQLCGIITQTGADYIKTSTRGNRRLQKGGRRRGKGKKAAKAKIRRQHYHQGPDPGDPGGHRRAAAKPPRSGAGRRG